MYFGDCQENVAIYLKAPPSNIFQRLDKLASIPIRGCWQADNGRPGYYKYSEENQGSLPVQRLSDFGQEGEHNTNGFVQDYYFRFHQFDKNQLMARFRQLRGISF